MWIEYVQWKHFCNLYATEIQWGLLVLYRLVHTLYSYWNFDFSTGTRVFNIEIPLQASFNALLFFILFCCSCKKRDIYILQSDLDWTLISFPAVNQLDVLSFDEWFLEFPHERDSYECRICRDESSGCHICVLSCEACKRFFRKSIASYAYRSAKNCTIEICTSTTCQYCRLKKWISVGMKMKVLFGCV